MIKVVDYEKLKGLVLWPPSHDDQCMSVRGWGDGPCNCGQKRRVERLLDECLEDVVNE